MQKEYQELLAIYPQDIKIGKQHCLRFEVPTTWQIWENHDMNYDSTLSFADKEGFRCGTYYGYSVFNILTKKRLKLKEYPLIVMDSSFINYQSVKPDYMLKK